MAKPSNLTQAKDAYMAKRRQDIKALGLPRDTTRLLLAYIENAYYSGVADGLAVLDRQS